MSLDNPKLEQVYVLAAALESSTGIAASLTATNAQLIAYNWKCEPDDTSVARLYPGALGANVDIRGQRSGTCSFEVDFAGSGTAGTLPQWATTFLPACDMAVGTGSLTGTYTFARPYATATIMGYEDGAVRGIAGAAGTFSIDLNAGSPGRVKFSFKGLYAEQSDTNVLTPSFPTVLPPVVDNSAGLSLTSGTSTYTPLYSTATIDAGNTVNIRVDAGRLGAVRAGVITERRNTFKIDPEQGTQSARDWFALQQASTLEGFSLAVGTNAGNTVTIAATSAQYKYVPRGSRNGVLTREVDGVFPVPGFTIAFS